MQYIWLQVCLKNVFVSLILFHIHKNFTGSSLLGTLLAFHIKLYQNAILIIKFSSDSQLEDFHKFVPTSDRLLSFPFSQRLEWHIWGRRQSSEPFRTDNLASNHRPRNDSTHPTIQSLLEIPDFLSRFLIFLSKLALILL